MTNRPALAALALVALAFSLPQTAAAERMACGVRSAVVSFDGVELDASAAFELADLGALGAAPTVGLAVPTSGVEVLWCASPDDPRCSPADSSSGDSTQLPGGTPAFVLPAPPPCVAAAPASTLRDARVGSRARSGVRRSLDRPPR